MRRMKVVTKRELIQGVRFRWIKEHGHMNPKSRMYNGTVQEIRDKVMSLDLDTCSEEDVVDAMGHASWVWNRCDCCGESVQELIRFGDEPDYEANWQDICLNCLRLSTGLLLSKQDKIE